MTSLSLTGEILGSLVVDVVRLMGATGQDLANSPSILASTFSSELGAID